MSWTTAVDNLRTLLSDGPTDKLRALKQVFGQQDGVNTVFKTFEFRRVTDFSASALAFPLGVYVNGVWHGSSAVTLDNPGTGFFQSASAFDDSVNLTCSYYIQWFTDSELTEFMTRSANWIGYGDNYPVIPDGLKPAALEYGAHEAYKKLSLRFAENIAETYRLQDSPDEKKMEVVKAYQDAAESAYKRALAYRDDFYTRKGMAKAPISGVIQGRITNPTVG